MKQSVKMIAGNWKMHGLDASLVEVDELAASLAAEPTGHRVIICPPATLIERLSGKADGSAVEIGGQDCHEQLSGAFTGSISAGMLVDAGAGVVIVGHSERREGFGETDALVAAKAEAALSAGLEPIVCVGESLAQREAGNAVSVVTAQVKASTPESGPGRRFAVAYEPIWAIGTGLTPTVEQIAEVHLAIRTALVERFGEFGGAVPILYGGSVKPSNAAEILSTPEVGGALVGGASLKAADFLGIIRAA